MKLTKHINNLDILLAILLFLRKHFDIFKRNVENFHL